MFLNKCVQPNNIFTVVNITNKTEFVAQLTFPFQKLKINRIIILNTAVNNNSSCNDLA